MNRSRPTSAMLATLLLAAACVLTLLPFVWLIIASLKTNEDFDALLLPRNDAGLIDLGRLTMANLQRVFAQEGFGRALVNSLFLSSVTAVLATLCCAMGGYALAKHRFRGRRVVTWLVLGAVLVPPPLLLAPGYQLLYNLGLFDTLAGVVLPACAPAFGVFLFRQAILSGVPGDLIESARLDGCSELRLFGEIVLPLVRPMVGTFIMITYLGVWNNFVTPQVVLQSPENFPLSVMVAQLRGTYYQDYGLQMAGTVVSIVPVLALFLLLQREFVSGLTAGAVKG